MFRVRIGSLAVLLLAGMVCAQSPEMNSSDATPTAAKGHGMSIDVNGHKLEMLSEGNTGPIVVLESGFGATTDFWKKVQDAASNFAVVVSYDRAGVGKSELTATPRTALNIAQELRSALHAAHFAPPYLLVGHSIGSFYIRVFAHTYPDEVCGMVFVDPVPEDFYQWMRLHQAEDWKQMEAASSQLPEGLRNELAGKDESAEQARGAWPLPKVPMILLTATKPMPPYFTPVTMQAWTEMHQAFANKIQGIQHITTDKSTHMVPVDQPELIVDAIRREIQSLSSKVNQ
jgi:pimeloyl-ACP methyl ester carboxylesterase